MSLRSSSILASLPHHAETPSYRQPVVKSKIWGFEPFWKFVNYDVEVSSTSSTNSSGGINDDYYYLPRNVVTKIEPVSGVSNRNVEHIERIIPIQRVRSTNIESGALSNKTNHMKSNNQRMLENSQRNPTRSNSLAYRKPVDVKKSSNDYYSLPGSNKSLSNSGLRGRHATLPMRIPAAGRKVSEENETQRKFDSLPTKLEEKKLTSVLKKPGTKSDRKSLKKVAFLESSY